MPAQMARPVLALLSRGKGEHEAAYLIFLGFELMENAFLEHFEFRHKLNKLFISQGC
jgi:hypothetical protein